MSKGLNLDFHFGIKRGLVASNCETIVRLFWFGLGLGRFLRKFSDIECAGYTSRDAEFEEFA